MQFIAQVDNKEIWLLTINRPYELPTPFGGEEFVCAVFVSDPGITNDEQNHISDQIVAAGCRYALCAGFNCSSFHDAIDWADISRYPDFTVPDEDVVMTTWHEDETPADVIWDALNITNIDGHFSKFLILLIGPNAELENEINGIVGRALAGDEGSA